MQKMFCQTLRQPRYVPISCFVSTQKKPVTYAPKKYTLARSKDVMAFETISINSISLLQFILLWNVYVLCLIYLYLCYYVIFVFSKKGRSGFLNVSIGSNPLPPKYHSWLHL